MEDARPVNKFRGRVVMTSKNREEITVRLEKGGQVVCENRGFRIGDEVCLIFDALNHSIIDIMFTWVADLKVEVGENEILQQIIQTPPEEDSTFNDDVLHTLANLDPIEEVIEDESTDDDIDFDIGQNDEISPDISMRDDGIDDEEWHSGTGE